MNIFKSGLASKTPELRRPASLIEAKHFCYIHTDLRLIDHSRSLRVTGLDLLADMHRYTTDRRLHSLSSIQRPGRENGGTGAPTGHMSR